MDAVAVDGARTAIQVGLEATLRPRGVLGMFKAKSRMSPFLALKADGWRLVVTEGSHRPVQTWQKAGSCNSEWSSRG